MAKIVIGTRGSKLALWQAQHVLQRLSAARPDLAFATEIVKTEGDARHDLAPEAFGQEGIFTAELDLALLDRRVDVAVHSLKDLPTRLDPGLALAAVTRRASVRDLFIIRQDLATGLAGRPCHEILSGLPAGFTVGTSSLRRVAQLKRRFPALCFLPLRGNLDTRVRKLTEGVHDAIVVAEAGLDRLEISLNGHLKLALDPAWHLPAAGQGALALATRAEGTAREVAVLLDHAETRAAVVAERAAMRALGAGCRVPAGFLGESVQGRMRLRGLVGHPDGSALVEAQVEGSAEAAEDLGRRLAEKLLALGADEILMRVRG